MVALATLNGSFLSYCLETMARSKRQVGSGLSQSVFPPEAKRTRVRLGVDQETKAE